MLETKFVKHLQSRPYHIRVFIFVFTMATTGIMLVSLWAASLSNTFAEATQPKSQKIPAVSDQKTEKQKTLPSLWNNMKANIAELGGAVVGVVDSLGDNNKTKVSPEIEKVRQIKPVKLPTDKQ